MHTIPTPTTPIRNATAERQEREAVRARLCNTMIQMELRRRCRGELLKR